MYIRPETLKNLLAAIVVLAVIALLVMMAGGCGGRGVQPDRDDRIPLLATEIEKTQLHIENTQQEVDLAVPFTQPPGDLHLGAASRFLSMAFLTNRQAAEHLKTVTTERDDLRGELAKSKQDASSQSRRALTWLIVACVPLIGLGVIGLLTGSRYGVAAIVSGVAMVTVAQTLLASLPWLSAVGGVLFATGLAFVIWSVWRNRHALWEAIATLTRLKMTGVVTKQDVKVAAAKEQSVATSKLIDAIRVKQEDKPWS